MAPGTSLPGSAHKELGAAAVGVITETNAEQAIEELKAYEVRAGHGALRHALQDLLGTRLRFHAGRHGQRAARGPTQGAAGC